MSGLLERLQIALSADGSGAVRRESPTVDLRIQAKVLGDEDRFAAGVCESRPVVVGALSTSAGLHDTDCDGARRIRAGCRLKSYKTEWGFDGS